MGDDNYVYNPNLGNENKSSEYKPELGADDTGFNPNLGNESNDGTGFDPNLGSETGDAAGFDPNVGAAPAPAKTAAAEVKEEIKEDKAEAVKEKTSSKHIKKKFNSDEIAMFCDQIAMLLNGGISVYEGTYMLYSEMEDSKTKEILREIDEQVKENIPLYKALDSTGAFPEYMIHMVQVGEKTGRLEEVMKSLAEYYEREGRVKAGLRSAVAYPMILFAVMACIMVVLVWKILPMFERMFNELSSDVATSTENVLSAGLAAGRIIAVVICALFAVVLLVVLWSRTKTGSRVLAKAANGFGPIRKIMILMATGKFVSSLALMMASGTDIREGLERELENCDNEIVRKRIKNCLELYTDGAPFDEAIRKSGLIVGMEARLISVASKTGETDVIFTKLSEQYNDKTSAALGRLTTVIETTLVVVLSLMVGAVLLAVMLPLVSMISSVG